MKNIKDDSIIPNNSFELKTSKAKKNTQTSDVLNTSNVPIDQIASGLSNDSKSQRPSPITSSWNVKSILLLVASILLCLIFLALLIFMVYKLFKKPARSPVYIEMDDMNSEAPIVKLPKNASFSVKNNSVQLQ